LPLLQRVFQRERAEVELLCEHLQFRSAGVAYVNPQEHIRRIQLVADPFRLKKLRLLFVLASYENSCLRGLRSLCDCRRQTLRRFEFLQGSCGLRFLERAKFRQDSSPALNHDSILLSRSSSIILKKTGLIFKPAAASIIGWRN